ncbi:iron-containing redox enzyme family protein [Stigmatella sp. ncwal1]|uniref:Iron-containing redox enzyme family protein n=1 Tax=Stigmatella ashevillensis TaxID=2995309 RepID=A0ABT5DJ64_9BACT|nr:iron-containing redox enzyme family protein [Stigmatella ashevillena]MDC0713663.1 iron-containing redox enzyme family protein [Stigmatella ashevillena]
MSPVVQNTEVVTKTLPPSVVARSSGEAVARRYGPPALKPTPHPEWMEGMLVSLRPEWEAACWPGLFKDTADGKHPSLLHWQRVLSNFFFIVESFPKYMGLSLAKTTYGQRPGDASARRWLLQNLGVEARHAEWYLDWMVAIGVNPEQVFNAKPLPEILALHEHLVEMCTRGTLAEGVAASNWAIEGVTGVWTEKCEKPFREYARDGVRIDGVSMMWLKAHARYDDAHPEEALEIVKAAVDPGSQECERVVAAARKSLKLYTAAIEACCAV